MRVEVVCTSSRAGKAMARVRPFIESMGAVGLPRMRNQHSPASPHTRTYISIIYHHVSIFSKRPLWVCG